MIPTGLQSLYSQSLGETYSVHLELYSFGRDFLLSLSGGEAHLGSLAISEGQEFHQITLGIHKEKAIAQQAVEAISPLLPGELLVIGGIHYPGLEFEAIQEIIALVEQLLSLLQEFLKSGSLYGKTSL